ncbi:MAG: hypothetical protein ACYCZ8_15015, partial [Acidimicrobiales bacterium]
MDNCPSGCHVEITCDDQRATVVEVGGEITAARSGPTAQRPPRATRDQQDERPRRTDMPTQHAMQLGVVGLGRMG